MSGTEGGGKEGKGDENRAVAVQQDPKNVAELTNYIQNMLQQMQDRWGREVHVWIVSSFSASGSRPCPTR